jgi:hypothetical protein
MNEGNKFVRQLILNQIPDIIPNAILGKAIKKHKVNRYYKKIPLRVQLISFLYGVFSHCNGLREIWKGMLAYEGKLTHLGSDKAPARSTLSGANTRRSYLAFETIYFEIGFIQNIGFTLIYLDTEFCNPVSEKLLQMDGILFKNDIC